VVILVVWGGCGDFWLFGCCGDLKNFGGFCLF
jgi:hypothetical protein